MGRLLTETLPDPDGAGPLAVNLRPNSTSDLRLKRYQLIRHPWFPSDGQFSFPENRVARTSWRIDWLWISHWQFTTYAPPDTRNGGSPRRWESHVGPFAGTWRLRIQTGPRRKRVRGPRRKRNSGIQTGPRRKRVRATSTRKRTASVRLLRPTRTAKGNRLTLTDPVNNTTTWVYDGLDRVISETNSLNQTRYFEYDAAGNVTQFTDRNGRVTTYDYDNLQRRTTETWLDGATPLREFSYSYDTASQLIAASDPAASFAFTFDDLGRNTSVEHALAALSFDVVVDHTYDPLGRRTSLSVEIDSTGDLVNQYQYDYLNRITRITQAGQSGGNAVAEKRVDFEYDLEFKNRFAEITRYADLAGSETVAVSSFAYDFAGRLTGIDHRDSAAVLLAGYSLSYDEGNRLTEFLVAGYSAEDAVYSYDDTDQLIGVDRDGTANDESYTYDENGNRIGGGYSGGGNNQLLSDGTYNYTFDDEGNRLTKTSIATGEMVEYSWDHRNRLTAIVTKDDLGVITHEVQYTYDIFNRRIVKTIDADGAGPGAVTQEIYIYDGLREERGSAGDHILLRFDESENVTGRYLHGPDVDQVLAGEDVTSSTVEGEVLWALTDHLGTVRDLAEYDAVSGDTTVVNHIVYDAFGRIVSETDSTIDFLYGFTGRERDTESDLQYNRARYYDAALGRWLSQDPIGFEAGDANLYRYVGNRPITATDPSGLEYATLDEEYIALGGPTYVESDYLRLRMSQVRLGAAMLRIVNNGRCDSLRDVWAQLRPVVLANIGGYRSENFDTLPDFFQRAVEDVENSRIITTYSFLSFGAEYTYSGLHGFIELFGRPEGDNA